MVNRSRRPIDRNTTRSLSAPMSSAIASSLVTGDTSELTRFVKEQALIYRDSTISFPSFINLLKTFRSAMLEMVKGMTVHQESTSLADTITSLFDTIELIACEEWENSGEIEDLDHPLLFKKLINQSNDAIFIVSPDTGKVLYINNKACANLGYTEQELLRMHVFDYGANVPDLHSWVEFSRQVEAKGYQVFVTEQIRRDGTRMPVEINVRHIKHNGNSYMISVVRDITERLQAEEALLEEKNKLEAVVAAIGDGITLQDKEFKILFQNSVHKQKQGDHQGEICYRAYQRRETVCDGCLLEKAFTDGKIHHRETSASTDKGIIHMEVAASPIKDAHGAIIAGIEVVRDITARKKIEEELSKAQKLESLGLLAGGIAHDFNNLLTTILGSINLLLAESRPGHPSFELLTESEHACLRARDLTQQLLTFSRGGAPIKKSTSIGEIIEESARFAIRGTTSLCTFRFAPHLSAVNVDEGQISQVINNLVINAAQAMPHGGTITIEASNVTLHSSEDIPLPSGDYIAITVADEGPGIPAEYLLKIFDPFFTTKDTGTGLGLAISYSIVKKHDGCITVESEPGKGSKFHIYLPTSQEELVIKQKVEEMVRTGQGEILFMDDDESVRDIAGRMLRRMGFSVTEARDGEEALKLYREKMLAGKKFTAVIMDLTIPGHMGGKEAIRHLLNIDPDAKAFVSSGYSHDAVMAEYKKYGFTGVIAKPFLSEDMAKELQKALHP